MTGSIIQAFNVVKNYFSNFPIFGADRQPQRDREQLRQNGGYNHHGYPGLPQGPQPTRLFSVGGERASRKRPSERVVEIELELTDDEDEKPGSSNHLSWSGYYKQQNLPKRFKGSGPENFGRELNNMSTNDKERIITRNSGVPPDIPGLEKQPWQFNFKKGRSRSNSKSKETPQPNSRQIQDPLRSGGQSSSNAAPVQGSSGASFSQRRTSQPRESQTVFSNFQFTKPPRSKEVEVITISDDKEGASKQMRGIQDAAGSIKKREDTNKKTTKKPFSSLFGSVGHKAVVDPLSSTIRLEEKNMYKTLIQNMGKGNPFGRQLQRSKLNHNDLAALYHNWPSASPEVSFARNHGRTPFPSSKMGLSDRVRQDLRLFSTPTASRSSGSTPVGPTTPPVLIDLEEEEKKTTVKYGHLALVVHTSPGHSRDAELSFSTSFADLDDALSSTRYVEDKETSNELSILEEESKQEDDDIQILSESLLNKCRTNRVNSLALEQNLSPYVNRSWLNGISSSFHENQKQRDKKIKEHLLTIDVLQKESTLEKDLRDQIRKKLTLTEIIVLEEVPPPLPELTGEMVEVIDRAKRPGRDEEVISQIFNVDFTRGDVKTLAPCKWLNDNVINLYMELIAQRSKNIGGLPKVYVFTTFFYPKLLKEGYSNPLKRWTRKVDIFENDLIFFPIHLGLHWCLACADLRKKTVRYFDSLGGRNDKCLNALLNYLALEMKERKGQILVKEDWVLENVDDIPQQQNGSDCGVFTCKFAEYLSREANLTFLQENMNYYRMRMIYEIIEKDLMYP